MKTFFIGCTHFGHENIIKYANRPFRDAAHMDREMIRRWNAVVGGGDIVYHLGDFCMGYGSNPNKYLPQLNGNVVRIRGNHDKDSAKLPNYVELRLSNMPMIVLMHYPIEEWNGYFKGAIHLHAHTHKPEYRTGKGRYNVGADSVDFTPIELPEVIKRHAEYAKQQ